MLVTILTVNQVPEKITSNSGYLILLQWYIYASWRLNYGGA